MQSRYSILACFSSFFNDITQNISSYFRFILRFFCIFQFYKLFSNLSYRELLFSGKYGKMIKIIANEDAPWN